MCPVFQTVCFIYGVSRGPCFDSEGNAVDASAKDFPIICFSLERLSSRLSNDTVQPELLALVLHEVSHGEGVETTESEAVIIQNIVKSGLTNEPYSKILNLVKSYRSDFKDTLVSNLAMAGTNLAFENVGNISMSQELVIIIMVGLQPAYFKITNN